MESALIISTVLLWILVLVLLVAVVALARQIGVLHERVAPVGALMSDNGPAVGEIIEAFELPTLDDELVRIGGTGADKRTLVYFTSPTCPICKSLLPVVLSLAEAESGVRLVLASDGETPEVHKRYVALNALSGYPYVLSESLGMRFGVDKLPYAVLLAETGELRSRGLVNSREHLESLLEADENNVASLQEYLGLEEKAG